MMTKKVCFKCGREKPIEEFYEHPAMTDGHLGKCKECTKKDAKANYRKRRDKYAAYERLRFQQPGRRQQVVLQQRKRRKEHPERYVARQAVANALRGGRLIRQPCEVCGDRRSQAHHEDYSRPLEVVWLCRKHHLERHGKQAYPPVPTTQERRIAS